MFSSISSEFIKFILLYTLYFRYSLYVYNILILVIYIGHPKFDEMIINNINKNNNSNNFIKLKTISTHGVI